MCLCGMLAAEYQTLPKPMRSAVVSFFDDQEAWLVGVLEQGRGEGTLRFSGSASEAAQVIVGGLEGAMLVTRPYGDPARFQIAADRLLASFAPDAGERRLVDVGAVEHGCLSVRLARHEQEPGAGCGVGHRELLARTEHHELRRLRGLSVRTERGLAVEHVGEPLELGRDAAS